MLLQAFVPVFALLAAASAHPRHLVSGDRPHWRSWLKNSSLPIGTSCSSGLSPNAHVTSAVESSTLTKAIEATTTHETPTVSLWQLADASAPSVDDSCAPLTTTTVVIVYETVYATADSPATQTAKPPSGSVSILSDTSSSSSLFSAKAVSSASSVASTSSPEAAATPPSRAQQTSASTPSTTVIVPASSSDMSSSSSSVVAPAAQSTSSTIAASTPATPSSGSKRGVIANPIPSVVAPLSKYQKISWDMNWWHGTPPEQPGDWQFVPQLTHPQPDQWWPNADFRHDPSEFPYIASFLEPDGHVSIEDAVQSWKTNLQPLASSHTLIPPMVGQEGLSWLQNFTAACTGCTLDKGPIAFTIYASADEGGVADFKNHLSQFKAAYPDRELWVANIGQLGTTDPSAIEWLMRQLVPYLESEPAVTRYAWNGDKTFWDDSTGSLTPLAQLYATL